MDRSQVQIILCLKREQTSQSILYLFQLCNISKLNQLVSLALNWLALRCCWSSFGDVTIYGCCNTQAIIWKKPLLYGGLHRIDPKSRIFLFPFLFRDFFGHELWFTRRKRTYWTARLICSHYHTWKCLVYEKNFSTRLIIQDAILAI